MTATPDRTATLRWSEGELLRGDEPYRLLSGSIHYFRVHPDQWEDRLRRLAAMGANTVDTYVAWNFHERVEGEIDFTAWRDLERFITVAGEVGLDVLLRPSPYICAEWANGGLPSWLTGRLDAQRTADPAFLAAIDRWYDALIPRIVPLQKAFGGPIVAVQVENEYGSFGSDSAYLTHLRDGLRDRGVVELLTTADGTEADMQRHGSIPGALGTFTFGSGVERAVDLLPAGNPLVCGELWGGWFDHWGESHHVRSASSMMGTIDELFDAGGSISLYMAHGGTNFGLWAGANHDGVIQPTVTSYDSDAPIGEDGRVNAKFTAVRDAFAAQRAMAVSDLPALPADPVFLPHASHPLTPMSSVADIVTASAFSHPSPMPLSFESLGVDAGIVAYRAEVSIPAGAVITLRGLRDRAIMFFRGERVATLEHDGEHTAVLARGGEGDLVILVESLGRINYGPLLGESKGIIGGVTVGKRLVHGWTHAVVLDGERLHDVSAAHETGATHEGTSAGGVGVASVPLDAPADAWLAFPGGRKGFVWLNGFLLGRYWERGPQVTLYAPAPLWRAGRNEIRVFDVDGLGASVEVRSGAEFGPVEEFIGV